MSAETSLSFLRWKPRRNRAQRRKLRPTKVVRKFSTDLTDPHFPNWVISSEFSVLYNNRPKDYYSVLTLLQVSKDEILKLVQGFEKQDILTSSGVTLAGSRYIYLSGTDRVIRAKLGKVGVHCMKTTQGESRTFLLALRLSNA